MTQWYYSDYERNRHGPVKARDLADLHANGQLAPDTLVWREGLAQWQPWRTLVGEVIQGAGRPAVASASFATASAAAPAAADANPYSIAEPASPYAPPRAIVQDSGDFVDEADVVYAGFWRRYAALVIDSLVVGIAYYAILFFGIVVAGLGAVGSDPGPVGAGFAIVLVLAYVAYPVVSGFYYVGLESSARQATLGKMAVGIKVTDSRGHRLGTGGALGRWASHLLCYFTLYIGYIIAAFTDRKRGLHDMVASTLVVDRWAYTAHPERQQPGVGTVAIVIIILSLLLVVVYMGVIAAIALPAYQEFVQRASGR